MSVINDTNVYGTTTENNEVAKEHNCILKIHFVQHVTVSTQQHSTSLTEYC